MWGCGRWGIRKKKNGHIHGAGSRGWTVRQGSEDALLEVGRNWSTTSTTNSLREWGIPCWDYSWLQRKLFSGVVKREVSLKGKTQNHIPKDGRVQYLMTHLADDCFTPMRLMFAHLMRLQSARSAAPLSCCWRPIAGLEIFCCHFDVLQQQHVKLLVTCATQQQPAPTCRCNNNAKLTSVNISWATWAFQIICDSFIFNFQMIIIISVNTSACNHSNVEQNIKEQVQL